MGYDEDLWAGRHTSTPDHPIRSGASTPAPATPDAATPQPAGAPASRPIPVDSAHYPPSFIASPYPTYDEPPGVYDHRAPAPQPAAEPAPEPPQTEPASDTAARACAYCGKPPSDPAAALWMTVDDPSSPDGTTPRPFCSPTHAGWYMVERHPHHRAPEAEPAPAADFWHPRAATPPDQGHLASWANGPEDLPALDAHAHAAAPIDDAHDHKTPEPQQAHPQQRDPHESESPQYTHPSSLPPHQAPRPADAARPGDASLTPEPHPRSTPAPVPPPEDDIDEDSWEDRGLMRFFANDRGTLAPVFISLFTLAWCTVLTLLVMAWVFGSFD